MHILHYLKAIRFEDGGVVRAVLDMCTYQARAGADVTLATCDDKDVPAAWKRGEKGCPRVAKLPMPGRLAWLDKGFAAAVEPLVQGADGMHMHVIWDPAQLAFTAAGRRHRKPYCQSPHGMLADWSVVQKKRKKQAYMALFGRRLIDEAAFIVLTAQGELDQSAKRHPKTPGRVIPLVFDTDPYKLCPTPEPARQNLKLPPTDLPSVLYLSRLHYKKRPDLLLAAGRAMRDAGHRFNLVFGGPVDATYDAQLRDYAKQLKVDDLTTFLGMVPAEYKPSLYNACDLFVLPTSMENFGFVYFESLACATPLVTTKGTDTWRELQASGGGTIVEMIKSDIVEGQAGGGDVRELAAAIGGLIADRPSLKPRGHAGREWVMTNMDPMVVAGRYLQMYADAAAGRRA